MYVIGQATISGVSSPIIITPNITFNNYTATVSQGFGYNNVYLSTDPNATSGSPSGTAFPYGTTVYSFGILNVHASGTLGTLISGTKNTPGAIYRIGSKVISTTNNFGTIALGLNSMAVLFTGEDSSASTVDFYIDTPVSASGYGTLSASTSGNSITISCTTDDFSGSSTTKDLMKISHESQYSATCVLKNHAGTEIA
jgi:hypothetical protein